MLPRRLRFALSILPCLPLLTACGSAPSLPALLTRVQVERVTVPAPLLTCAQEPQVPSGRISHEDVAVYLLALAEAGDDCRGKLTAVQGIIEEQ